MIITVPTAQLCIQSATPSIVYAVGEVFYIHEYRMPHFVNTPISITARGPPLAA